MTPEQIAELEALAEKATPGPWVRSNDPKKWVSSLAPVTSQEWRDNVENDAALIATLVNSLPAILAALKAQQPDDAMVARVARVLAPHMEGGREFDQMPHDRMALRKWAREGMCNTNDATQDDALEAAQAAIAAMQEKPND